MKQRPDGRWVKAVNINGKRKYFYSTAETEKQANKDFNNQLLNYKEKEKNKTSFSYIAEIWNAEYREKISDINYKKNTNGAYIKILDYFKDYDIHSITAVEINLYISQLISQMYSKKTIASYKCILNMIFQYALIHGYVKYNPVRDIRLPNNLPKSVREIPSDEVIKMVDSHYDGFDFLPYFLLYTGLRLSEAMALQYSDIDFKKKTVIINKHLIWNGNQPVIENKTKTESGTREVILLDRVFEKLPKNKKGYVFCREDGRPYTQSYLKCKWRAYRKKYGISALTAHQLRHAYATMLYEAGIDLKDAQSLMGHSDINLTRQIYTHIRNKRKEETACKLNQFKF